MTTWRKTTTILMVGLIFFYTGAAFGKLYPAGTVLHFRIVATSEDVEFARKYLGRYFEGEEPAAWDWAIQDGEIKIARVDLDDDGIPEILIMVERSGWCGSIGCRGLRWGVLVDAGWMDNLGRWTGKAASHGVKNDVDFLDHPEAQEAAMTDALRVYDCQARALGLDRYVDHVITGLNGSHIRMTRAGIIAAAHRAGVAGVADSLARLTTNKKADNRKDKDRDTLIRKRLREFDRIAYQPEHK